MPREPESNNSFNKSQSNAASVDTTADALEVIREEQGSPTASQRILAPKISKSTMGQEEIKNDSSECTCKKFDEAVNKKRLDADEIEKLLREKEEVLRAEYDKILEKEMDSMKERFNFILLNEQHRSSYMLREAHRERQEKITALQSQLQCKNLAALMYVMCTEKRRSRLEKLRIIRDYTNYIHVLQDILAEGQDLILHLSRGYKTAARVDHEWREKMKKVVSQFLAFIYNFAGGSPETNQFYIDLPKLLKTKAPIVDNPNENPCDCDEEEETATEIPCNKTWWERLDDERRPFVMYGDMSEFRPPERREVLKKIKAAKTAPKKWRNYVFNDKFFEASCGNTGKIKDMYLTKLPQPTKWECNPLLTGADVEREARENLNVSKMSLNMTSRRMTTQSIDIRGTMGSLLKMISANNNVQVNAKTALLGARDSMEITSTTKLKENRKESIKCNPPQDENHPNEVVLAIGKTRGSVFNGPRHSKCEDDEETKGPIIQAEDETVDDEETMKSSMSQLGSIYNDSLLRIPNHVPDRDNKITYERVCPMERCQRLQVDSFMRSLPPYMRASPFTFFEQTFEEYETCTPEQLELLKQRIENKKHKEVEIAGTESPLEEWIGQGVAVQTSDVSLSGPPCTCHVPSPTPVSSNFVFDLQDLLPVKHAMDAIHQEVLYDDRQFNNFKLVGQENGSHLNEEPFKEIRYNEIKKILKQHPSLLDIFQANTR